MLPISRVTDEPPDTAEGVPPLNQQPISFGQTLAGNTAAVLMSSQFSAYNTQKIGQK